MFGVIWCHGVSLKRLVSGAASQTQKEEETQKGRRALTDEIWLWRLQLSKWETSKIAKSIKIHQNVFFQKESISEVLQLCSEFHSICPEEEKSEESEHARRRRKVAESDWNVKKTKKTIRPPYWRNSTDTGKNTGVALLRALTSTWPASPFLHTVYQTIIILSQIRLDHLVISTIFR